VPNVLNNSKFIKSFHKISKYHIHSDLVKNNFWIPRRTECCFNFITFSQRNYITWLSKIQLGKNWIYLYLWFRM